MPDATQPSGDWELVSPAPAPASTTSSGDWELVNKHRTIPDNATLMAAGMYGSMPNASIGVAMAPLSSDEQRQVAANAINTVSKLGATEGGPIGATIAGGGNLLAQAISPGPINRGEVAQTAALAAIPFGSDLSLASTLGNLAKFGAGGYGSELLKQYINTGKMPQEGPLNPDAIITGLESGYLAAAAPWALNSLKYLAGKAETIPAVQAVRSGLAKMLSDSGATIPAHITNPSGAMEATAKAGGESEVNKAAALKNQPWAKKMANKVLGNNASADLNNEGISDAIKRFTEPYEHIASVTGKEGKDELLAMREKLSEGVAARRNYNQSGDARFKAQADEAYAQADKLSSSLEDRLNNYNIQKISSKNPEAKALYDKMQANIAASSQLRAQAQSLASSPILNASGKPISTQSLLDAADRFDGMVQNAKARLNVMVQAAGMRNPVARPFGQLSELDVARKKLAQVRVIGENTNLETGAVNIRGIAADKKVPTQFLEPDGTPGNLDLMARAGEAFPELFRTKVPEFKPTADLSKSYAIKGGAAGALVGGTFFGPHGAAAGAGVGAGAGKFLAGLQADRLAKLRANILSPEYLAQNAINQGYRVPLSPEQMRLLNYYGQIGVASQNAPAQTFQNTMSNVIP